MQRYQFSRRGVLFGLAVMPGCTALSSLNQAAQPRDTYDLAPVNDIIGRAGNRTLLVLEPTAPATIATNRILIKPQPQSVTYLPDARWADEAPLLMQSLMIRSLSSSGQFGFVGPQGAGPVPDFVLLSRLDEFGTELSSDGLVQCKVAFELTLLRDRDQRVIGTRQFGATAIAPSDQAMPIVLAFQQVTDTILPQFVRWVGLSI